MQVPKLRFKEFNDEWKTKKIHDICELLKGGNLSKNDLSTDGISCILYGELYTKYNEIINNVISKTKVNNLTYSKKNDILMPSSGETAIDIATASCLQCDNIALGGDINVLRPYKDNGIFISYQLNGKNRLKIAKLSQGIQVVHMYNDTLKNISINLPSLEEQTKIADFLSLIDKKIELQTQLVDNLNLYKKGLLKKVFSNTQGWKTVKLGEFLIEYNEKTTINNQYPVLTSSRKGLFLQRDYFDKQVASDNNIGYNILPYNYITYRNASDDATFYFNINNIIEYGIVSPLYPIFTTKDMNIIFLQLILNYSNEFKKYCLEQQQGGTRTSMSISKLKEFKIKIPSIEEQNRIAELFSSIDDKISYETNKLNNLKEYKKGLLQQMFI